jgi:hypothetical protein
MGNCYLIEPQRNRIGNFKIQHPNFKEASKSKLQPEAVGTEFSKFEVPEFEFWSLGF